MRIFLEGGHVMCGIRNHWEGIKKGGKDGWRQSWRKFISYWSSFLTKRRFGWRHGGQKQVCVFFIYLATNNKQWGETKKGSESWRKRSNSTLCGRGEAVTFSLFRHVTKEMTETRKGETGGKDNLGSKHGCQRLKVPKVSVVSRFWEREAGIKTTEICVGGKIQQRVVVSF